MAYDILVRSDGSGSPDYTNLAAALSGASAGDVIELQGTWASADTTGHTISQAQTIQATGDAKHPGHPNDGSATHWRHRVTSGHAFVFEDDVTIDVLDIGNQSTGTSDECVRLNDSNTFTVKNCLIWFNTQNSQQDCFYFNGSSADNAVLIVENSILWGAYRSGIGDYNADNVTVTINSSTIYAVGAGGEDRAGCIGVSGVVDNSFDINIFNSILHESSYDGSRILAGVAADYGTVAVDRCITNESSIDNVTETDCTLSATFADTTGSSAVIFNDITGAQNTWDLRLQDHANNIAKDAHSDGSGASLTMPSTDLLGTTRDTPYCIGAFEIAAGGTAVDVDSADLLANTQITNTSIQRIRNLSVADFSSASSITSPTVSIVVSAIALNFSDLSSSVDITDLVIQRIRNLTISDLNSGSALNGVSLQRTRNLSVSDISSNSEISDLIMSRVRNLAISDLSSNVDITDSVLQRIRNLSFRDISSSVNITDMALQRIRNLIFSDMDSNVSITEIALQRIRNLGIADISSSVVVTGPSVTLKGVIALANLSSSVQITSPSIQRIRNLSFTDVSSASEITQVLVSTFIPLSFEDISVGTQITSPTITASKMLTPGQMEIVTEITSPIVSRLRTISIEDINAISSIGDVIVSNVTIALGTKNNKIYSINTSYEISQLSDNYEISQLSDNRIILLLG